MKKIILILFLPMLMFAQSNWHVDYYGNTGSNNWYSDSLTIAVGDSASSVYQLNDQLWAIGVDSNWTTSKIVPMVYNELEDTWEMLYDEFGSSPLQWNVAVGKPIMLNPKQTAGLKKIKFLKYNGSTTVNEATAAGKIIVWTIRFN